jgi:DNA-3-methyladenine glycosylase II
MSSKAVSVPVLGPWSLSTCRRFWEGFVPAAALAPAPGDDALSTIFRVEADWSRAAVEVRQEGSTAHLRVAGPGNLDAAVEQVARFLVLDVDASAWPEIGRRDPVIGRAQSAVPGLRPCGFHSPYEAAIWAVLSQRISMVQAARIRDELIRSIGDDGALPAPADLLVADLDLPGRKAEYLAAVAEAALEGRLDTTRMRGVDVDSAVASVQEIKGLGPFSAELVVLRGANAPDGLPSRERRLDALIDLYYGPGTNLAAIAEAWRPFRTWAVFHLRAMGAD